MPRLCCLGLPHAPCFLLQWKGATLLLDCELDLDAPVGSCALHAAFSPSRGMEAVQALRNRPPASEITAEHKHHDSAARKHVGKQDVSDAALGARVDLHAEPVALRMPGWSAVDFGGVDAILLSNHQSFLGLPYITQRTGFRGRIFATSPTIQFGRMMMMDLLQCSAAGKRPIAAAAAAAAAAAPMSSNMEPGQQHGMCHSASTELYVPPTEAVSGASFPAASPTDRTPALKRRKVEASCSETGSGTTYQAMANMYDRADVLACVQRISALSYGEAVDLNHDCAAALKVTPVSSGFAVGAANWCVESADTKLVFVAASSAAMRRHPRPLDVQAIQGADCVVLGPPSPSLSSSDAMFVQLGKQVVATVSAGGSVLLPTHPTGVVLDLLEYIASFLEAHSLSAPLFFVGPSAPETIAYSSIISEWLCAEKQSRVQEAASPFVHHDLIQRRDLVVASGVYDPVFVRAFHPGRPCVVLTSHPSLRFGDALYFLRLWSHNPKHALILTDPAHPRSTVFTDNVNVAALVGGNGDSTTIPSTGDSRMQVVECPIDTRLTVSELNSLLRNTQPKHVVAPAQLCTTARVASNAAGVSTTHPKLDDGDYTMHWYSPLGTVDLSAPLASRFEDALLLPELAAAVVPRALWTPLAPVSAVRLRGMLHIRDNRYEIGPVSAAATCEDQNTSMAHAASSSSGTSLLWGTFTAAQLLQRLAACGVVDAELQDNASQDTRTADLRIRCPSLDATVEVRAGRTTIKCNRADGRAKLKDIVTSLLIHL